MWAMLFHLIRIHESSTSQTWRHVQPIKAFDVKRCWLYAYCDSRSHCSLTLLRTRWPARCMYFLLTLQSVGKRNLIYVNRFECTYICKNVIKMFQLLPCRNTKRLDYEDWSINPVREIVVYCENCIPFSFFLCFVNRRNCRTSLALPVLTSMLATSELNTQ
jgi:hypothetical protein